jgi:hypothetical protein
MRSRHCSCPSVLFSDKSIDSLEIRHGRRVFVVRSTSFYNKMVDAPLIRWKQQKRHSSSILNVQELFLEKCTAFSKALLFS